MAASERPSRPVLSPEIVHTGASGGRLTTWHVRHRVNTRESGISDDSSGRMFLRKYDLTVRRFGPSLEETEHLGSGSAHRSPHTATTDCLLVVAGTLDPFLCFGSHKGRGIVLCEWSPFDVYER